MSKFDLKDKIDSLIFSFYNIVSDVLFLFSGDEKSIIKKNKRFKNTAKSERCFIFGTGPSLNEMPEEFFDAISKECSFGVNFLYKSSIFEKIKPDYYTLMDDLFWGEYSNAFSEITKHYGDRKPTFITDCRAKHLVKGDSLFLYAKNYPVGSVRLNLCGNSSALMNVLSYSISSAIFLGFKEIYLVGCDYNAFCTNGVGHCYDDEELKESGLNLAYFLKFYHITTEIHYLLAAEAKKYGVKIINITDRSLLDAYPRMSYRDLEW